MKLYSYYRSSAAFRVRIALNVKAIPVDYEYINLLDGKNNSSGYDLINPAKFVPALQLDDGTIITQSSAIIEYLEEVYPAVKLLPQNAVMRAKIRSVASIVAADVHPLNNLRIMKYLTAELAVTAAQKDKWYARWIHDGFSAIEKIICKTAGTYAFGASVTMADAFLVPQVYNARRFNIPLYDYPTITKVADSCMKLEAFQKAAPEAQVDCN